MLQTKLFDYPWPMESKASRAKSKPIAPQQDEYDYEEAFDDEEDNTEDPEKRYEEFLERLRRGEN